jgi:aspartyl-tRNA(Asn)/glutamyl-tRNA(Gln) amidotransferase subunit A
LKATDEQLVLGTIAEIGALFRKRKLSPLELTRALLDRIDQLNPLLNAYLTVCAESALKQAARAEMELGGKTRGKKRDRGPLHGIPISLKDNIYSQDVRTTGGSKILQDFVPLHDAPVVAALKTAGAVILGKTNMHEFAYGTTTDNPHFGPVRNPWDQERIAGGSSGGSAAALAAGLCYGSIGTDTGGSIRIPAALCGVVGVKPGLGRVSVDDVIPLSPTLDFVGPLARTIEDAALMLGPICVRGKNEPKFRPGRMRSRRGRRPTLGIPKEFFLEILDPEVHTAFETALRLLEKGGAQLKEVSFPQMKETEDAGTQIALAESTAYHQDAGWYPARSDDYGEDVRSRLELGTKVTAVRYLQAREFREKFKGLFHETMSANGIDALVAPTTPIAAPKIGEETVRIKGSDYPVRALLLRLNRPANIVGVPAISVPCGLTKTGLPVGLQFIGDWADEALLLEIARGFERAFPLTARPEFLPGE